MLTMWLSFTMSEVRGIRVCDIKDGIMTINQVVVDVRGMPVAKAAGKEYDRNRALAVPPYIMRLIEDTPAWKNGDGYIITASGESIRGRFRRLCAKADVDITFHDLRHVNARVFKFFCEWLPPNLRMVTPPICEWLPPLLPLRRKARPLPDFLL